MNEERKDVKIGIRYVLRFDGNRGIWSAKCFPYSDDVVIHYSVIVSVPANWNSADICSELFLIGEKIYYFDDASRLIYAGAIKS